MAAATEATINNEIISLTLGSICNGGALENENSDGQIDNEQIKQYLQKYSKDELIDIIYQFVQNGDDF